MDGKRIPFVEEDERAMASAASWGTIVAITSIISALIGALSQLSVVGSLGAEAMIPVVISAGVQLLLAMWLLQASGSFKKVATTDEADQAHLLSGFRKLRAYFMLQVILILLIVGLVLLGALVGASFLAGL